MIITNEQVERKNNLQLICEDKENWNYNAPHSFLLVKENENDSLATEVVASVHFQEGPVKEVGLNGFGDVDLLLMVKTRLQAFQATEYACKENAEALVNVQEAITWLTSRTRNREARGVEGTSQI